MCEIACRVYFIVKPVYELVQVLLAGVVHSFSYIIVRPPFRLG